MAPQSFKAVDIARRPNPAGDIPQGNVFTMKLVPVIGEVVHDRGFLFFPPARPDRDGRRRTEIYL
jgi:hypothetical protein